MSHATASKTSHIMDHLISPH